MDEGAVLKHLILYFGRIDDENCGASRNEDFDMAGECV